MGGQVQHHAMSPLIFKRTKKYLIESFAKYNEGQEIKYPLNFNTFRELFSEGEQKGANQSIPVDHG